MPISMTGFGRAERVTEDFSVTVEVRSVNNRYLNAKVRLPARYSSLEPKLEAEVRRIAVRGTVDLSIRTRARSSSEEPVVDMELARGWLGSIQGLASAANLNGEIGLATLLQLPGVVRLQEDSSATEREGEWILKTARAALTELQKMRAAEGERMGAELLRILTRAEKTVKAVASRAAKVPEQARVRLVKRIEALLAPGTPIDAGILEREIAVLADRADVTEELARLASHFAAMRSDLAKRGAMGRRLDFLVQEMAREANTIASKSQDAMIARKVIELRAEIERLREQVQNVE